LATLSRVVVSDYLIVPRGTEGLMSKVEKRGLGRGLSALISPLAVSLNENAAARIVEVDQTPVQEPTATQESGSSASGGAQVKFISISQIVNNSAQPRQHFSDAELSELADSIKTLGVLQPVLVRQLGDKFEIVAGERRWRAAQKAGLTELPVFIRALSEMEVLQIALVENVQREQLNPLEEAHAYDRLMREFKLTQDQVAEAVGKNRASIANYLRLLKLAPEVLKLLQENRISMGHAKAILTIREPSAQVNLARKIVEEGLSVRAVESIVGRVVVLDSGGKSGRKGGENSKPSQGGYPHIEDQLRNALGTRVHVRHGSDGKGRVEIEYFSEEELDRIVDVICND
jgi:ParB family chromosome partitioning protein